MWDSFWSAWDAFAGANDYREAIQRAVAYGNDTDTTAAIAGGLAGIRWGIDGIPAEWLSGMRGREIVEPLVTRLTKAQDPIRVRLGRPSRKPSAWGWFAGPTRDSTFCLARRHASRPRAGARALVSATQHTRMRSCFA